MRALDTTGMDRVLNSWLEENGFECEVTCGTDFAYYYASSTISYALVVSERADRLFLDFANRHGLNVDCGVFLLSFFHELGHNETLDDVEEIDYNYSQDVKATLGTTDEDFETYFNLPDEIVATEWAIDYINNHTTEVAQLAMDFQREFATFVEENEIRG